MPRGGAHHILSPIQRDIKYNRIEDCFKQHLTLRQAVKHLEPFGRGYGMISIQKVYKVFVLKVNTPTIENIGVCLKVNTESSIVIHSKKHGVYDDNLQGYMLYFINVGLRNDLKWLAEDIRSECVLSILTQDNLKHLGQYMQTNQMPRGRDLSLLKAVMFRQRLKYVEKETRRVMISYVEEYQEGEDYG
jgi:hypothetical protein